MIIMKAKDGLVIYSPVPLDRDCCKKISELGKVKAIIAPNLMHYMFLRDCIQNFPDATIWVPKGLEEKIGLIAGAKILDDTNPVCDSRDLEQFTFDEHGIRETLLFHHASKTLITADLIYNYQREHHFAERLFFRLTGAYGHPAVAFYHQLSLRNRSAVKALTAWVNRWPIKRIIMSHGRIVEDAGSAQIFTAAWARFY